MSEPFRTETVTTEAGDYVIELSYDPDAENPLTSYDHPGMMFYVVGGRDCYHDTIDPTYDAGAAWKHFQDVDDDFDAITRRFDKWRVITGSPWILVSGSGSGYSQSEWWTWFVLVDTTDYVGEEITKQATNAAHATMDVYRTWARGEFVEYVITDPDGTNVDSLCGIDDEKYALREARDSVAHDAVQRKIILANMAEEKMIRANLVGAGFVGIL